VSSRRATCRRARGRSRIGRAHPSTSARNLPSPSRHIARDCLRSAILTRRPRLTTRRTHLPSTRAPAAIRPAGLQPTVRTRSRGVDRANLRRLLTTARLPRSSRRITRLIDRATIAIPTPHNRSRHRTSLIPTSPELTVSSTGLCPSTATRLRIARLATLPDANRERQPRRGVSVT
jgi:hypothetical protein